MNVEGAVEAIKIARKSNVALMMHGPGGVGKSAAAKQAAMEIHNGEFAKNEESKFTDVNAYMKYCRKMLKSKNLSSGFLCQIINVPTIDPTDLMGVPVTEKDNGNFITSWARPDFIHEEGNGIILLDEVPDGDALTTKACYGIVLDKQIKEHRFGDGWSIFGAGNRPEDKAMARVMPAPLITRMCHIGLGCDAPNFNDHTPKTAELDARRWGMWAIKKQLKSEIVAFIQLKGTLLYHHQATPRTWELISRILEASIRMYGIGVIGENTKIGSIVAEMVRGTVGRGPGTEFMGYMRLAQKIPDIDALIKDPMKSEVPKDLDIQHAVCMALIYRANSKNLPAIIKYGERLNLEITSFMIHAIKEKDITLIAEKCLTDWINKHQEVIFD